LPALFVDVSAAVQEPMVGSATAVDDRSAALSLSKLSLARLAETVQRGFSLGRDLAAGTLTA
jgi:hypothetical protein